MIYKGIIRVYGELFILSQKESNILKKGVADIVELIPVLITCFKKKGGS